MDIWKELASYIWALMLIPLKLLWDKADKALPREEFEEAKKESQTDRQNIRQDIKELYEKDNAIKELVNARSESLRVSVQSDIKDLRNDVTAGFNAIRDEMRTCAFKRRR